MDASQPTFFLTHWVRDEGTRYVDLEVTLNGQDYLRMLPQGGIFTYYALDVSTYGLSAQSLEPHGGPSAGGTLVRVAGSGFYDLGGLLCYFTAGSAATTTVPATRTSSGELQCSSPAVNDSSMPTEGNYLVQLTLNGQANAATSALSFAYYPHEALRLSHILPH